MQSGSLPADNPIDRRAEVERLERLADLLDARFGVPGIPVRFGLDSVVGLIPGVGDGVMLLPTLYMIYCGYRLGMPANKLAAMGANAGIDLAIGAIPIIGDLFDVAFKANRRNVAHIRRHVERTTV